MPMPGDPISPYQPADGVTFNDDPPREQRAWALPLFLGLSFLAHSLGFYAFHVVYPKPRDVPTAGATLSLVPLPALDAYPAVPDETHMLRNWLADSDPALLTTWKGHQPNWEYLEQGRYVPLFEDWSAPPALPPEGTPFTEQAAALSAYGPSAAAPPAIPSLHLDLGQAPGQVDLALLGFTPPPTENDPPAPGASRVWIWPLAGSEPALETEFTPPQLPRPTGATGEGSYTAVQNPEYLLGTDGTGKVLFILTRRGSNSEALDQAAEGYLRGLTLGTAAGVADTMPLRWWHARLAWGREVFAP